MNIPSSAEVIDVLDASDVKSIKVFIADLGKTLCAPRSGVHLEGWKFIEEVDGELNSLPNKIYPATYEYVTISGCAGEMPPDGIEFQTEGMDAPAYAPQAFAVISAGKLSRRSGWEKRSP